MREKHCETAHGIALKKILLTFHSRQPKTVLRSAQPANENASELHPTALRGQGGKLARDRAGQGLFRHPPALTGRPKPPSTRVGSDMTTLASLTSYVSLNSASSPASIRITTERNKHETKQIHPPVRNVRGRHHGGCVFAQAQPNHRYARFS